MIPCAKEPGGETLIGAVADTHGLPRPELLATFEGVAISRASGVGKEAVLMGLPGGSERPRA